MGSLKLQDIRKSFGTVEVLKGIDLEVKDGEFVVFVGPSGCGKSTLLRIIAGLEDATSGDVLIDGDKVNNVPPAKRGIAMVFQTYALYPHLTVRDNMGLGLKQAGTPAAEIDKRIAIASAMLSLEPYLKRRPAELVRRPAPARRHRPRHRARAEAVPVRRAAVEPRRGAARQHPARDRQAAPRAQGDDDLRHARPGRGDDARRQDRRAQRRARSSRSARRWSSTTTPANDFVAGFIGSPKMNFIEGARLGDGAKTVGVRPEHISVSGTAGDWKGTVVHAEHLGPDTNLYLDTEKAGLITVRIFGVYDAEPGATLFATPEPSKTYRFDAEGSDDKVRTV